MKKRQAPPAGFDSFALRPSRREFLLYMGSVLFLSACGGDSEFLSPGDGESPPEAPLLPENPFRLGVASGDPLADRVMLWTRLAPRPVEDGGMPAQDVPVIWEVARDRGFRQIVRSGWAWARPEFAHSVHVDVDGLSPSTTYFYRLRVGDQWSSEVARTRTLPARGETPDRFRFAVASCQNYRDGYYHAHAAMAEEDLDLVFFLGDYIYETGIGADSVRQHDGPAPETLPAYRNRYALYKSDPNLIASHQAAPWVVTWDDHELLNNYANVFLPNQSPEEVRIRRRAAYQAYWEHQPIRVPFPSDFADLQLYRSLEIGRLASVSVLDTRQYRDTQACFSVGTRCPGAQDPDRSMLGSGQREWLTGRLRGSDALWNIVAQQVVFAPIRYNNAVLNPDQWDGYAAERQALLDVFAEKRNVVVLTGDIHMAAFGELTARATDRNSETVGYEVVCTSISSGGNLALDALKPFILPQNPQIRHLNAGKRGYAVCEFRPDRLRVEYRIVNSVIEDDAAARAASTDAVFEVDRASLEFEARPVD